MHDEATYVEWCLTINIGAVNIDFIVIKESNNIVDIRMRDRMEHDVASDLFDLTNHNFKLIINSDSFNALFNFIN